MKIIFPQLKNYYLFDYFKYIIYALVNEGHVVDIYMYRGVALEGYSDIKKGVNIKHLPYWIEKFNMRSSNLFFRVCLWVSIKIWGLRLRGIYDFALLPDDQKIINVAILQNLKGLTANMVTNFLSINISKEFHKKDIDRKLHKSSYKMSILLDKIFKGTLLPKIDGSIMDFRPANRLVDRLFGSKPLNPDVGFSNKVHVALLGSQVRQNYIDCGVKPEYLHITGNPSYDRLSALVDAFSVSDKHIFRKEYGLDTDKKIYLFFLSPSTFTDIQIKEVITVIQGIYRYDSNAFICMKFHPKTDQKSVRHFKEKVESIGCEYVFITKYTGDDDNIRLMTLVTCLFQKQSTIGYAALHMHVPIISYNLFETNYEDDMYKEMGGSWHVETQNELDHALNNLANESALCNLWQKQDIAAEKFCIKTSKATQNFIKLISDILGVSA